MNNDIQLEVEQERNKVKQRKWFYKVSSEIVRFSNILNNNNHYLSFS